MLQFIELHRSCKIRLRAELAGIDIRPFQMHAQHPRAAQTTCTSARVTRRVASGCEPCEGKVQICGRCRHGGGKQRRRTVLRVQLRHARRRVAAFHDVVTTATVDVLVDEPRQDDRLMRIAHRIRRDRLPCDAGDASAAEKLNHAGHESLRHQDIALNAVKTAETR